MTVLRRPVAVRLLVLLLLLPPAGCAGLPDSGPVNGGRATAASATPAPADFHPAGPLAGASREQVVAGFLRALLATPASTRVAEEFLTADAAADWQPQRRTVVYGDQVVRPDGAGGVVVELSDTFELDATGRWRADAPVRRQLPLTLVRDGEEWRIADPPDAMVVSLAHVQARYRRFSLYFFDATGSVVVPEPVYLPVGVQTPTQLVAGLLGGPGRGAAAVERSFLPGGTRLQVSVPVGRDGVAEVPLSLTGGELDERALAQLTWTLQQVPEVTGVRVSVDGTPLELPGGGTVAPVGGDSGWAPGGSGVATALHGLRGRQILRITDDAETEVGSLRGAGTGPPRSLAVDLTAQRFAVVDRTGTRVVLLERDVATEPGAAGDEQTGPTVRVRTAWRGEDLLQPMWDRTGRLWLVDRRADGRSAEVVVLDGARVRRLTLPGPAREVVAATLSRDGTRLVLATGVTGAQSSSGAAKLSRLEVLRVVRRGAGVPARLTAPQPLPAQPTPGRALPRVRGLAWPDPTTVAVLSRPTATTSRVDLLSVDGAPEAAALEPGVDALFAGGTALAAAPDSATPIVVAGDRGDLHRLDGRLWQQVPLAGRLREPAYPGS